MHTTVTADVHANLFVSLSLVDRSTLRISVMVVVPTDPDQHLGSYGQPELQIGLCPSGRARTTVARATYGTVRAYVCSDGRTTWSASFGELEPGERAHAHFDLRFPALRRTELVKIGALNAHHYLLDPVPGSPSGIDADIDIVAQVINGELSLGLADPSYELTIEPTEEEEARGTFSITQQIETRDSVPAGACHHWPCMDSVGL